jgi:hypothetical protein
MNSHQKYLSSCLLMIAVLLSAASFDAAWAQTAPDLKTASRFAILSATPGSGGAVSCTGGIITGDVGSSGGSAAVVQTEGCMITGAIIAPVSAQVLTDFNGAYDALANTPCDHNILDAAFTGNVPALGPLAPGVYCFPAGVGVAFTNTTLTLDGPANGIWIFKVGAALAGSGFRVVMTGGGQPCNVFWSVGAAATLTTSTLIPQFQGNILAGAAISFTSGTLAGRALAKSAVTMTGAAFVIGCDVLSGGAVCKDRDGDDDDKDKDKEHKKHKKDGDEDEEHGDKHR